MRSVINNEVLAKKLKGEALRLMFEIEEGEEDSVHKFITTQEKIN